MTKSFLNMPNFGKLVLRFGLGFIILLHGIHKLRFGIAFIHQWITSYILPALFSYGVYIGEVVAPIMLILGLFTRVASFIIILNMIVAILYLYTNGFAPFAITAAGGLKAELDIILLLVAVGMTCVGGGTFGLKEEE